MWSDAAFVLIFLVYFAWLNWREFKAWKRRHDLYD
ncbi:hypothetical protein GGD71_006423 [Variovorax guangxiensis]|uniref:Uncharacterized protein n=1 Tax=Variovorax guangxiensis TaxID=1775474 RepID=A0A840G1D9_9BURK|nr:hypothetical protein [Variovorax guangxiensis]